MFKIVRASGLDPAVALNDLEDAVNLFIGNGWFPVGSHQVTLDNRTSRPHFIASQGITNSLTVLERLTDR